MIFVVIGLVVLAVVAALLALLGYQLTLQSGRILERVDALDQVVASKVLEETTGAAGWPGLAVGTVAPSFQLPDLDGNLRSLTEWRGRRVLLLFFEPGSLYCRKLLPYLSALPGDVATNRPAPLIVSSGDLQANRDFFDAMTAPPPVLCQTEREVATAYQVDCAPAAYVVGADGLIETRLAYGLQQVIVQAGEVRDESAAVEGGGPDLSASTTVGHEGLAAGQQAPIFRLPRLGGGELSLLEYRGKKTLLVFSDPECEPCVELAPHLRQLSFDEPELAIVIVSRGDPELNTEHARQAGLTIPICLQRSWEVSREYAMMGTPIGYLIDEWGVIASRVAVGEEAILSLGRRSEG